MDNGLRNSSIDIIHNIHCIGVVMNEVISMVSVLRFSKKIGKSCLLTFNLTTLMAKDLSSVKLLLLVDIIFA